MIKITEWKEVTNVSQKVSVRLAKIPSGSMGMVKLAPWSAGTFSLNEGTSHSVECLEIQSVEHVRAFVS